MLNSGPVIGRFHVAVAPFVEYVVPWQTSSLGEWWSRRRTCFRFPREGTPSQSVAPRDKRVAVADRVRTYPLWRGVVPCGVTSAPQRCYAHNKKGGNDHGEHR